MLYTHVFSGEARGVGGDGGQPRRGLAGARNAQAPRQVRILDIYT